MKLPYLDKNAFLAIYINKSHIYANLIYADYTSGRHYSLSDTTKVGQEIYEEEFWIQYFQNIEKTFNWDILREGEIKRAVAEGLGVAGICVYINQKGVSTNNVLSVIREVSHEITFQLVDENYISNILSGVSSKRNYDDILFVDAGLFSLSVIRYLGNTKQFLSSPKSNSKNVSSGGINWQSEKGLIEGMKNAKIRAFLSAEAPFSKMENLWANYVLNQTTKVTSEILADEIRSFLTLSLLSILNDNREKFADFGQRSNKNLVVITGDMVESVPFKMLAVSVIDGLEITGDVDLVIDKSQSFLTFGKSYIAGIDTMDFVIGWQDIAFKLHKFLIPEISGKKGEKKVIFTGHKLVDSTVVEEVFALAGEIVTIQIEDGKHVDISGKFIKGANMGEVGIKSSPLDSAYKTVLIDGRYKPIVYGPDARSNKNKISSWLNEIN